MNSIKILLSFITFTDNSKYLVEEVPLYVNSEH